MLTVIPKIASTAYQVESVAITPLTIVTQMNVVLVMEVVSQEHAILEKLVEKTIFLVTIQICAIAKEQRKQMYVFQEVRKYRMKP